VYQMVDLNPPQILRSLQMLLKTQISLMVTKLYPGKKEEQFTENQAQQEMKM